MNRIAYLPEMTRYSFKDTTNRILWISYEFKTNPTTKKITSTNVTAKKRRKKSHNCIWKKDYFRRTLDEWSRTKIWVENYAMNHTPTNERTKKSIIIFICWFFGGLFLSWCCVSHITRVFKMTTCLSFHIYQFGGTYNFTGYKNLLRINVQHNQNDIKC